MLRWLLMPISRHYQQKQNLHICGYYMAGWSHICTKREVTPGLHSAQTAMHWQGAYMVNASQEHFTNFEQVLILLFKLP